jgi:hypothetical protein
VQSHPLLSASPRDFNVFTNSVNTTRHRHTVFPNCSALTGAISQSYGVEMFLCASFSLSLSSPISPSLSLSLCLFFLSQTISLTFSFILLLLSLGCVSASISLPPPLPALHANTSSRLLLYTIACL